MNQKPKPQQANDGPRAHPGDEVYFRHAEHGPMSGKVLAAGAHGCTVKCPKGQNHKVRWSDLHGHKQRAERHAKIIEQGEDGSICETEDGKRFYLAGDMPKDEPEQDPVEKMTKALRTVMRDLRRRKPSEELMTKTILFIPSAASGELLAKATIKGAPGVALQMTSDKTGHSVKRWKKTGADAPANQNGGKAEEPDPEDKRGSQSGYGSHNIESGDRIGFKAGEHEGEGEVTAAGKDGATVKDGEGREHQVHWHEVSSHNPKDGTTKPDVGADAMAEQKPVPAAEFKAHDYAQGHDMADVDAEHVLSHFPPDTKDKIKAVQERLAGVEQTIDQHKVDGSGYSEERAKLHEKIISHFLSPEKIEAAKPPEGEAPSFTILGGRGGSGKSWFEGNVYDPSKAIVLDADEIKGMMPEYEGWNAHQVHEESGDLFDHITDIAQDMGLNIVHDATMKTASKAQALVKRFKDDGYQVEAHYMHLPRQEAAKRAVSRFLGKTQRYVPVEVVLSNTGNEAAFDSIRDKVDKWSFRDNNVPMGQQPILISQSEEAAESVKPDQPPANDNNEGGDGGKPLQKAMGEPMMILWRTNR